VTDVPPTPPAEIPEEIEGGFSRRAVAWIVGTVAASFVAALLLGVYGSDLERRPEPGPNTFSHSALGHRALAELLRSMGLGVVSSQSPAGGGAGPRRPLIVAEPDLAKGPGRLEDLRREAKQRGASLVLVLPKWRAGGPRKDKPEWLASVDLLPLAAAQRVVRALGDPALREVLPQQLPRAESCSAVWGAGAASLELRIEIKHARLLIPSSGLTPVVGCDGRILVAKTAAEPPIFLVTDPDLLNNHGFGRGENAIVVVRLLTEVLGATGVVFDETVHGFNRAPGLMAEAVRFPMSLGVLQSLILLGIVLWAGMGRFGKPLPAPAGLAAGKEILIDNTAKLLAGGGHAGDSLADYFRQTTRAVAAHYFLPPDLPDGERLARLQRISDARGGEVKLASLERRISQLPDGRRGEEQAARIARRLHDWRVEMANGNRESP
jgi:uncharacterized protein DUF4350